MNKKKLLIIAAANNFHFIHDIVEAMRDNFEIDCFGLEANLPMYDIIWHEWVDGLLSYLLKIKPFQTKCIVRLHRYELFTPRTLNLIQQITDSGDYKKIDKLVFVSEFVRQIGISKFPWMAENSVVIPNLFNHTKFPFVNKKNGHNLLFLGRISYVKNLPLCLTIFHELLKYDNKYKLHIVGEILDPELKYYAENFISKTKIQDNIIWLDHIPYENISRLMKAMNYIVCSSIFESQGMGIIEGMSCGLKPTIFNFPGAKQFYPSKWLWTDRTDFMWNILNTDYNPKEYHDYVVKKFSIEQNIWQYKDLIREMVI